MSQISLVVCATPDGQLIWGESLSKNFIRKITRPDTHTENEYRNRVIREATARAKEFEMETNRLAAEKLVLITAPQTINIRTRRKRDMNFRRLLRDEKRLELLSKIRHPTRKQLDEWMELSNSLH